MNFVHIFHTSNIIIVIQSMNKVNYDMVLNHETSTTNPIMACKISPESNFLAVGDAKGKLNIYEIDDKKKMSLATQIKAHAMHHDWMKKREIQPSIGCIQWMRRSDNHNKLITTNGVAVKLWRLKYLSFKQEHKNSSFLSSLPSQSYQSSEISQLPRLHLHMIDSLSVSANQQYLLSSDGCSLMKWCFQKPNKPFIINVPDVNTLLDFSEPEDETEDQKSARVQQQRLWQSIKPATTAKFCHSSDNRMVYASKYGQINYIDMRSSNSIVPSVVFNKKKCSRNIEYYLSVMSDLDFPENQNLIVSRDYLYTYIWDIRNPTVPTFKMAVFSTINNQICEMYQQSKIFDRFQVKTSRDCSKIITTHYQDSFHKILVNQKQNFRFMHQKGKSSISEIRAIDRDYAPLYQSEVLNYIDYNQKSELIAACTKNNIYLYGNASKKQQESCIETQE